MSDINLYLVSVAIWGSTWLAIKFQLGTVAPAVSIVWRFTLAAAILLSYAGVRRLPLRFSPRQHAWMALQGICLYGVSYVGIYRAEQDLTSGLVAVLYSLTVLLNILGVGLFFGTRLKPAALLGAVLGIAGLVLIFWPQRVPFGSMGAAGHVLRGVLAGLLAVVFSSLGNMVATRTHRSGLPVIPANGWAMLYGVACVAAYAALQGEHLRFEVSAPYVLSLLYLAVFGSVIAFTAYLTLLGRIGAHRAGYCSVAIPIVALALSTLFEHLQWHWPMLLGVALCVLGNVLVLGGDKTQTSQSAA